MPLKIIGEPWQWKFALDGKMISLHPIGIVISKKFYIYKQNTDQGQSDILPGDQTRKPLVKSCQFSTETYCHDQRKIRQ